jgi:hypothetical protein
MANGRERRLGDSPTDGKAAMNWLRRNVSLLNTLLLAILALMALWLRGEFFQFAKQELQPLAEKLVEEKYERTLAVQRVENSTARLDASVKDLNDSIKEMRVEMRRVYEEAVPQRQR